MKTEYKIIGNGLFAFCKKLTQVNLPETVEEIGYYAFDNGFTWIPLSLVDYDTNLNGKVDVADARLALRAAVKLETLDEYALQCADIDKSGIVEIFEARKILRKAVGLE